VFIFKTYKSLSQHAGCPCGQYLLNNFLLVKQ
jgi:hypothetical protein